MLSMPPATMMSLVPASSRSWASIAAFMPEPHILLMVVQPADERQAGAERGLARRRLSLPGGQHAAHDDFLDLVGLDAGALDRGADRGSAELVRGEALEFALQGAHRGTGDGNDDDRIIAHSQSPLFQCRRASLARVAIAESQGFRIRKYVLDVAIGDALPGCIPEIRVQQVGVAFEERLAHPRIAQQERGEFFGKHIVRADRIPGFGGHLVFRRARPAACAGTRNRSCTRSRRSRRTPPVRSA